MSTRIVTRRSDGKRYWCTFVPEFWPGKLHLGPCFLLLPCGVGGRRHYKTIAAFTEQYLEEDGRCVKVEPKKEPTHGN